MRSCRNRPGEQQERRGLHNPGRRVDLGRCRGRPARVGGESGNSPDRQWRGGFRLGVMVYHAIRGRDAHATFKGASMGGLDWRRLGKGKRRGRHHPLRLVDHWRVAWASRPRGWRIGGLDGRAAVAGSGEASGYITLCAGETPTPPSKAPPWEGWTGGDWAREGGDLLQFSSQREAVTLVGVNCSRAPISIVPLAGRATAPPTARGLRAGGR